MPKSGFKLVWPLALTAFASMVSGTVLQQLTLAEMSQKSTSIVRARIKGSGTLAKNPEVYTVYTLDVLDTWKDGPKAIDSVAVPGGVSGGARQMVAGAPVLRDGEEYVLFLWTSRAGVTQVIGLSQGLFRVVSETGKTKDLIVTRAAITERMVDAQGHEVQSPEESMKLSVLRRRVETTLHGTKDARPGVVQKGSK